MTSKLYEMLNERYPKQTENSASNISIYGADERIYLSLFNRSFVGKDKKLITHEEIDKIAREFFSLFYRIRELDRNHVIILNPNSDIEHREYEGHLITVFSPFFYPRMEISTGNRVGNFFLTEEQRQRYFGFIKDIYGKFLENAKKA